MGKIETNSGNDTFSATHREVWVGMEECPDGRMLHIATGTGDSPTNAVFAVLQASADDAQVSTADWYDDCAVKLPAWTGRLMAAATARGMTAAAVKTAARRAFKS
jgi:hypothetical protein